MDEDKGFSVRNQRAGASDESIQQQDAGPVELDFSTFVISLATSAQVGLGAVPHPETNQAIQNFPAAKQMIDILALLKEKTRGNLTEDESSLLDQVLHNLRIHYVRAMEGQNKSGG